MTTAPIALRIPDAPQQLQLYVHGEHDRHVSRRIREQGIWEPFETALFLACLRPGGVCVDVGANLGYFSTLAASLVGDSGSVFAFEPDPDNFSLLERNLASNGLRHRVHAQQAGLSDVAGTARLFLSDTNLGDHQVFATEEHRTSVPVALFNGSDYLEDRLTFLDLLKVDTQGAEYQVMSGLMPLLQSLERPPRIIIELTPLSLRQAGASGRMLVELLSRLGLPMWIVDHLDHRLAASTAAELADWCDNVDAVPYDAGFMNILVGAAI